MLVKIILWILSLFGYKKAAAQVEAAQEAGDKIDAEQVQEIETHEQQIDAQNEADKSHVGELSESELDAKLRE